MTTSTNLKNHEVLLVGEGSLKRPEALTMDLNPALKPDVVHDLNVLPWPFADNTFKKVICHHVLEHLKDFTATMAELHRICRTDGEIYIEVPHFSCFQAYSPEHTAFFNYGAIDPYVGGFHWVGTERRFALIRRELTFHRTWRFFQLHRLFNRFPEAYERFWTYIFPAEHLKFWLRPVK